MTAGIRPAMFVICLSNRGITAARAAQKHTLRYGAAETSRQRTANADNGNDCGEEPTRESKWQWVRAQCATVLCNAARASAAGAARPQDNTDTRRNTGACRVIISTGGITAVHQRGHNMSCRTDHAHERCRPVDDRLPLQKICIASRDQSSHRAQHLEVGALCTHAICRR